jgi:hypothetical protein
LKILDHVTPSFQDSSGPHSSKTADPHLLVVRLVSGHPYYRVVDGCDADPYSSALTVRGEGSGDHGTVPDDAKKEQVSRSSSVGFLKRLSSFMPYPSIYGAYAADPVVQLSTSQGDGRRLAGVHVSGRISVWSLPGQWLTEKQYP